MGRKKGQKAVMSGYHRGMRVVMLIKIVLFAIFAILVPFSFWHNLCTSG